MLHSLRSISLAVVAAVSLIIAGCSDDDAAGDNIRMQAEISSSTVSRSYSGKNSPMAGDTVESLTANSVKALLSEIKLKYKDSITEAKIKTGPAILSVVDGVPQLTVSSFVPEGTYDKVHFKFHKLEDDEALQFSGDPAFSEFVTPERYTIIIEGTLTSGGSTVPFVYRSRINQELKFETAEFSVAGDMTILALDFNMPTIFKDKKTGAVLDPRDPENKDEIDEGIKAALKILRKQ